MNKKQSVFVKLFKGILCAAGLLLAAAALLFGWLTATEYRPAPVEKAKIMGEAAAFPEDYVSETFRILTWNTGYGALGDNADFFMDGGKSVNTADEARVRQNLQAIADVAGALDPDLIFFQEADVSSARSHRIDETAFFREKLTGRQSTFGCNFRVPFLPYPVPPIGKVDSGVQTLSKYEMADAERITLPCPFTWPVRIANLKRCLLLSRIDLPDTDRQLVLVNFHLEAYDSGEGKIEQTRMLRQILSEETEKGNYVIAGGDFNQTFPTVDPSLYPAQEGKWQPGAMSASDFPEDFRLLADAETPTCRSLDRPYAGADHGTFQYYVIDGFVLSPNVEPVSLKTLDEGFTASDHNPVLLEFRLRK